MTEIEPPIEAVQEHIHEAAHHARESWISKVALFSAIVAVVAAVAALMAGHHSNEAMISQIKASDSWSYYQAKGIKASVLQAKTQILTGLGKSTTETIEKDNEKIESYKKEQEEISEKAKELEEESKHHLNTHVILARSVTFFQVAIAISAVAVLTRKRRFWLVGVVISLIGLLFFIQGLVIS